MKSFVIKVINLFLIVGIVIGYNVLLEFRNKDDEIAKLNAQLQSLQLTVGTTSDGSSQTSDYKDGTYSGEAQGFGGMIEVEVVVKDKKITNINIKSADGEDSAYLTMAKDIIDDIIDKQSSGVDTISGATFSSTGIKDAVAKALEKAVN